MQHNTASNIYTFTYPTILFFFFNKISELSASPSDEKHNNSQLTNRNPPRWSRSNLICEFRCGAPLDHEHEQVGTSDAKN